MSEFIEETMQAWTNSEELRHAVLGRLILEENIIELEAAIKGFILSQQIERDNVKRLLSERKKIKQKGGDTAEIDLQIADIRLSVNVMTRCEAHARGEINGIKSHVLKKTKEIDNLLKSVISESAVKGKSQQERILRGILNASDIDFEVIND